MRIFDLVDEVPAFDLTCRHSTKVELETEKIWGVTLRFGYSTFDGVASVWWASELNGVQYGELVDLRIDATQVAMERAWTDAVLLVLGLAWRWGSVHAREW